VNVSVRRLAVVGLAIGAAIALTAPDASAASGRYTTWTFRARPPSYPQTPTMARTASGRLLAWSFCDTGCVGKVWDFTPSTNTWRRRANLPALLRHAGGAAVAGQVYSIGGYDDGTDDYSALVYVYDEATDTWAPRASLPAPIAGVRTAVSGNDIFAAGEPASGPSNKLYRYDPTADTWTLETTIPRTQALPL
jgi:N-acetylneuraminic acid mutarotase